MKWFVLMLFFLGLTSLSYSQEAVEGYSDKGLKAEELPEVVIKNAGKDFSVYLPDKTGDKSVRQLQEKFIGYNLGKDYAGYDSYLVVMESDSGTLTATYNENGKLIHVVENYENVRLPSAVVYSIYKNYPGWEFVNDQYLYSQQDGTINKKEVYC